MKKKINFLNLFAFNVMFVSMLWIFKFLISLFFVDEVVLIEPNKIVLLIETVIWLIGIILSLKLFLENKEKLFMKETIKNKPDTHNINRTNNHTGDNT